MLAWPPRVPASPSRWGRSRISAPARTEAASGQKGWVRRRMETAGGIGGGVIGGGLAGLLGIESGPGAFVTGAAGPSAERGGRGSPGRSPTDRYPLKSAVQACSFSAAPSSSASASTTPGGRGMDGGPGGPPGPGAHDPDRGAGHHPSARPWCSTWPTPSPVIHRTAQRRDRRPDHRGRGGAVRPRARHHDVRFGRPQRLIAPIARMSCAGRPGTRLASSREHLAAWPITGGLGVAIPEAHQLVRWWTSDSPPKPCRHGD